MSTIAAQPTASETQPRAFRSLRLIGLVVASILAGGAAGFVLGSRTGVGEPIRAAERPGAQSPVETRASKPETSDESERRHEIARLLEEVRTARALIESMRHDEEGLRAAARLRALEAARDSGGARLERLEQRLDRLENQRIDLAPTGSLPKSQSRRDGR